ncbi:hypothetical protein [Streptomyces yaizuensis]|uniref:Uncharacterized protein n=1 Tax=Streptomyces yaizuensis TaxID=2989713 RepID=A0ABQ5P506_9ACTN|nr:hypothetical protein [Streptomyces sp. YSPA8]GLF97682.1 hypothetical protein SYYSPA8_25315 [Streptomyces sp. YSPA8]
MSGGTMAERVLAQLIADAVPTPAPPPPRRSERLRLWLLGRWRRPALMLSGLASGTLVVLVLTPPVRAEVADWFGFGGVQVRYDPPRSGGHTSSAPSADPSDPSDPRVPWCGSTVARSDAERRAGFRVRVPEALGEPDAVSVTAGPSGRSLVSLCWRERGRTIRLDQFPGRIGFGFAKTVTAPPHWLSIGDSEALWFDRPHRLKSALQDDRGGEWPQSGREAGPTLLWIDEEDGITLRLEGVREQARAEEIAASAADTGTDADGGSAGLE